MKQFLSDILGFMKNLNFIDLLLYIAILVLLILIVSLVYIIKTTPDLEEEIIELEEESELDLKEVVNNIENNQINDATATFTNYEKDQEEKAIISYEELIAKNKMGEINYKEEEIIDDEILVKKINLDDMISASKKSDNHPKENKLFRYANEEAFLKTLQTLNELLN